MKKMGVTVSIKFTLKLKPCEVYTYIHRKKSFPAQRNQASAN